MYAYTYISDIKIDSAFPSQSIETGIIKINEITIELRFLGFFLSLPMHLKDVSSAADSIYDVLRRIW